ncbi:MAG: M15 family metallopeptidase [Parasporobacterium sp.]|nr:M15 family metallopeptidase [Parasporobacterium sp.]
MIRIWSVEPEDISAGTVLTEEAVQTLGIDNFFYTTEISDALFARMWRKSFKEYCTISRDDLRYIRCLHKDIEGNIMVGELVMNVQIADKVCEIFRKLYDASFPIECMRLVDDFDADDEASIMVDNTSAFNYRTVDNTDEISNHAYGLAIDINPYYNVYYIPSENYVFPVEEGWQYLDREQDFPYKVGPGDLCYELFTEAGFEWGGWWTYNTDYQHFQYVGQE